MKRWLPLFILALLPAAFFAGFTLEKQDRDIGPSSEARLNPWLAAGRVLEKQGQNVRFAPSYGTCPAMPMSSCWQHRLNIWTAKSRPPC